MPILLVGICAVGLVGALILWFGTAPLRPGPQRYSMTLTRLARDLAAEAAAAHSSIWISASRLSPTLWEPLTRTVSERENLDLRFIAVRQARCRPKQQNPVWALAEKGKVQIRVRTVDPKEQFALFDDRVLITIRRAEEKSTVQLRTATGDAINVGPDEFRLVSIWHNDLTVRSRYKEEFERAWSLLDDSHAVPERIEDAGLDNEAQIPEASAPLVVAATI